LTSPPDTDHHAFGPPPPNFHHLRDTTDAQLDAVTAGNSPFTHDGNGADGFGPFGPNGGPDSRRPTAQANDGYGLITAQSGIPSSSPGWDGTINGRDQNTNGVWPGLGLVTASGLEVGG
jgi:hypothetical protein